MPNADCDQLVREAFAQDTRHACVDQLVREAFVSLQGSNAVADQVVREAFAVDAPHANADQIVREVWGYDVPAASCDQIVREAFVVLTPFAGPSMPLVYPLTIPTALGESKADLTKFDAIGEFISEFTGNAEQQQWQDQHWELALEWPEMNWAQFAAYDAFIGALHGKLGSFLWGPPLATAPRGSGSGAPVLGTGNAAGSGALVTTGWAASASGLLLPGDFLQVGPYPLPIVFVQVTSSGVLEILTSVNWSLTLQTLLTGNNVSFAGLTGATWLNGAVLQVGYITNEGVGYGTLITMATVPPNMPIPYSAGDDTGNVTFGAARLYQYVDSSPLSSDSGGNATFDIFPCVREALPAGTQISLLNPQGTFRLADNRRTTSADERKLLKLKLKCREAF
jgi:hypothetical protein